MNTTTHRWMTAALALALLAPGAHADHGQSDDGRHERKIVIHRSGDGDAHDHDVAVHKVMRMAGHGVDFGFLRGGGGFLGVRLVDLTPELRVHFGVPDDVGVMVSEVVDDSPAFRAGVEVGDIVTGLDGEPVESARGLAREVRHREDGDAVNLELWRDGRVESLSAAVEVREPAHFRHGGRLSWLSGFECEDGDECRVEIRCDEDGGDECSCRVNGEERECSELGGRFSE